ncbi:MAG: hypothetical protein PHY47_01110 [Lachnospiraceae bacterium]|nr:hypothetical protein [Lachnospiraceae bacterium]
MTTENETETKEALVKGFTCLVDEQGVLKITPVNVENELEFIGFLAYANQKKEEILQKIANSPEHRTVAAVSQLTNVLGKALELASTKAQTEQQ